MHNLSSVGFDSKATKAMGRTMEDNINGAKCAGCWLIVVVASAGAAALAPDVEGCAAAARAL